MPTIRRNGMAAHWGCMRRSNMAVTVILKPHFLRDPFNTIRGEEVFDCRGNFHGMCLDCEMTCIEELDLCVRQVFSKSFGSRRNEKRIILAPDRKQWRLRLAKIFLKFRIERYIRCVIEKQVELNTLVAWTI